MNENALDYAEHTKDGIKRKADNNKSVFKHISRLIIILTGLSPLFILFPVGDNDIWWVDWVSRILPSLFVATSSILITWLQIMKHHERWVLYRSVQRKMEFEINNYTFSLHEYKHKRKEIKDRILADKINVLALELHYNWEPLAPNAQDIKRGAKL